MPRFFMIAIVTLTVSGCDEASEVVLPDHTIETSSLAPRDGMRVQVNTNIVLTDAECETLIAEYSDQAEPDGQVSVHMPSAAFDNQILPFCVDNFEGEGVTFNRTMFGQPAD